MNSIIGIIICIGFMLFAYAAGYKDGRESEKRLDLIIDEALIYIEKTVDLVNYLSQYVSGQFLSAEDDCNEHLKDSNTFRNFIHTLRDKDDL